MNNLYIAWGITYLLGIGLIALDLIFLPLIEVRGIPAFSILGAALVLLVFTSILNWIFKVAWAERRSNVHPPQN